MFFTQEDYRKIQDWLSRNSSKDSELLEATPLNGNEIISIVQANHNKKISIKDFVNQIFKVGSPDFFNVTDKLEAPYITLEEAINMLPTKAKKQGQVITFLNKEGNWDVYQFIGANNQCNIPDKWNNIFDIDKYIIDSLLPDEEDLTKTKPDAKGNSYVSLKDRAYNPSQFSGYGEKILRKHIIEVEVPGLGIVEKNILYQDVFDSPNTIYKIRYDFDLNGQTIELPENCILDFVGGSIDNGTLVLNDTLVYPFGCVEKEVIKCETEGTYKAGQMFFDREQGYFLIWDGENWKTKVAYRVIDNKLNESLDGGVTWIPVSDYIAAYFRWSPNNTIQISRNNRDWDDLSEPLADNVYIKGYYNSVSQLPSNALIGDIYMVGTGAPYNMYINTSEGWKNNGPFTSITAGIEQTTGQSTTNVMSQKAVTDKFTELESKTSLINSKFDSEVYGEVVHPIVFDGKEHSSLNDKLNIYIKKGETFIVELVDVDSGTPDGGYKIYLRDKSGTTFMTQNISGLSVKAYITTPSDVASIGIYKETTSKGTVNLIVSGFSNAIAPRLDSIYENAFAFMDENINALSGFYSVNRTHIANTIDSVSVDMSRHDGRAVRYGWNLSSIPKGEVVRLYFKYAFEGIDGNSFYPMAYMNDISESWQNLIDINGFTTETNKGYVEVVFVKDDRNIVAFSGNQYESNGVIHISDFKVQRRRDFNNTFEAIDDITNIIFQNDDTKVIEVSPINYGGVIADDSDSRFGQVIDVDGLYYTKIDCEGYSTISLKRFKEGLYANDKSKTGIVFYDYNGVPISGYESRTGTPHNYYEDVTLSIPSNAIYLNFTGYGSSFPVKAVLFREIKTPNNVLFSGVEFESKLRTIPLNKKNVLMDTGIRAGRGLEMYEGRLIFNPKVYLGGYGRINISVGENYLVSFLSYEFENINAIAQGFGKGREVQWQDWLSEGSHSISMLGSLVLAQIKKADGSYIESVNEIDSAIKKLEIESYVDFSRVVNPNLGWVSYYGKPIRIVNYAKMQKVMNGLKTKILDYSSQGGDIYNGKLFVGHGAGYAIDVYDFDSQTYVGQIVIDGKQENSKDHMNTMFFSDEYVNSSDEYPILYSCSGYAVNGKSYLHGYRIYVEGGIYKATLVHTITLEFDSWSEVCYDKNNKKWWIKHDDFWWEYDSIPYRQGDATINADTPYYRSFPIPKKHAWETQSDQDHKYVNGKIIYTSGYGGTDVSLNVINTDNGIRETQIRLDTLGVTDEPEFTFVYKEELYIAYRTNVFKINFK